MHGVLIMSRIGKHPVPVPPGVEVALDGQTLSVSGKLGKLRRSLPPEVELARENGSIAVRPRSDDKRARAMWGMSRTVVANMVEGVAKGFTRRLVISGVGYRAALDGKILNLQLGYSHDIKYAIPDGHQGRGRHADRDRDHRRRPPAGRADRGRAARVPQARALQGQGHPLRRRGHPAQGRQEEVEPWSSQSSASCGAAGAPAPRCASTRTSGRACRCSARASTSTPR